MVINAQVGLVSIVLGSGGRHIWSNVGGGCFHGMTQVSVFRSCFPLAFSLGLCNILLSMMAIAYRYNQVPSLCGGKWTRYSNAQCFVYRLFFCKTVIVITSTTNNNFSLRGTYPCGMASNDTCRIYINLKPAQSHIVVMTTRHFQFTRSNKWFQSVQPSNLFTLGLEVATSRANCWVVSATGSVPKSL